MISILRLRRHHKCFKTFRRDRQKIFHSIRSDPPRRQIVGPSFASVGLIRSIFRSHSLADLARPTLTRMALSQSRQLHVWQRAGCACIKRLYVEHKVEWVANGWMCGKRYVARACRANVQQRVSVAKGWMSSGNNECVAKSWVYSKKLIAHIHICTYVRTYVFKFTT